MELNLIATGIELLGASVAKLTVLQRKHLVIRFL